MTYQLAEDTLLLLNSLKKSLKEEVIKGDKKSLISVCEVGCGSGEIITQLTKEFTSSIQSFATDINSQAISDSKQLAESNNVTITFKEGSFCTPFENQIFDIIFFNTPYLPCEDNDKFSELLIEDKALYGGTIGCEVTNEFIDSLHNYIDYNSKIYILISTLTQPHLVEEDLKENGFEFEVIGKENHFFEELLVYKITCSSTLKYLLQNNYISISKFNKGKHSYILQAQKNIKETLKTVMIKTGKEQHILKEIFFLEKLQGVDYAPKIIESKKEFVIYEKIEGIAIEDFFKLIIEKKYSQKEVIIVLNKCLEICFDLDSKGICKDEMTRPHHHIYINSILEVFFIDFERSTFSQRFQNSRQFMQYLVKNNAVFRNLTLEFSQQKVIEVGKELLFNKKKIKIDDILI